MRLSRSLLSSLLLVVPSTLVSARSITGDRLLVVDEVGLVESYRGYIWDLEQRGYQITYLSPKDDALQLFQHGERKWDHIILLPPKSRAYGPNLTTQILIDFVNKQGNILVLIDSANQPEQLRDLGRELEIGLAPRGDIVVDHFEWLPGVEGNAMSHSVILPQKPKTVSGKKNYFGGSNDQEEFVAYRGTGHTLGNSPLLHPILPAPRTSYTFDPEEEKMKSENPWSAGQQLYLASGFQARNNARIAFVGSADSFTDDFQAVDGTKEGPHGHKCIINNRGFANSVTGWAFQELGVLKVEGVKHYAADRQAETSQNPEIYRIKSDVVCFPPPPPAPTQLHIANHFLPIYADFRNCTLRIHLGSMDSLPSAI